VGAPDVIVVGGGIIGMLIAFQARQAGLTALLLERGALGKEASHASAGLLYSRPYPYESVADFRLRASSSEKLIGLVPALSELSGIDIEVYHHPSLHIAYGGDDLERIQKYERHLQAAGLSTKRCTGDDARKLQPGLSPDITAALLTPSVNLEPRRLLLALSSILRQVGVQVRTGCPVVALQVVGARVMGVRTPAEALSSGSVVNAAGSWAATIAGAPEQIPVQPERGEILSLRSDLVRLTHQITMPRYILIPRKDGRIVLGATTALVGYERRFTAGGIARMLQEGTRTVPALAEAAIEEIWTGLRPYSADGYPLVGRSQLEGYYYATGHGRLGIQLAAVTAEAITELLTTGHTSQPISRWDPQRFGMKPSSDSLAVNKETSPARKGPA